jgi:hypothetical protein
LQPVAGHSVGQKKRFTKINQTIMKTCQKLIRVEGEKIALEQYQEEVKSVNLINFYIGNNIWH